MLIFLSSDTVEETETRSNAIGEILGGATEIRQLWSGPVAEGAPIVREFSRVLATAYHVADELTP